MSVSTAERLRNLYAQFNTEDRVLVVINADPDAIASAMAVSRLLWRRVAHVSTAHVNVIERPDNLAMIRLLKVNLEHIADIDTSTFNRFVMVDSQPEHHIRFADYAFDIIIDHHPDSKPAARFVDIRPTYGATATILTEYLRSARIKPSARLATGLFYAIKTDTGNFKRQALIEDVRAFQFLFKYANTHLARRLEQADLKLEFLTYFQTALERKTIRKKRIFVHMGPVVNPDVCVLVADFFMRITSINWTIVSCVYENRLVIIIRNDGLRKHAGQTAAACFGSFGSAGGHKSMARAEIQLEALPPDLRVGGYQKQATWIIHRIERGESARASTDGGDPRTKR